MMKIGIIYDTSAMSLGGHDTHFAYRGLPVEQVALVDSNLKDIEARMQDIGAKRHYVDYRDMMDAERPDIVVLGSRNPEIHLPMIEDAAQRGIHVLCEKPLCATLEQADRIVELSEKHHIKIAVAHLARYALLFRKMKEMIEAGAIGEPISVYGRGKEDDRGGGEDLIVLGTHILDVMNYLFGKPEHLFAEVLCNGQPLKASDRFATKEPLGPVAGDNVFAHLRYPNGIRGFFESRRGLFQKDKPVRMGVTVVGTKGALSMRYTNGRPGEGDRKLRLAISDLPVEDAASYQDIPLEETRQIPGAEPLKLGFIPYFNINNRFAAWDLIQAIQEDREPVANARHAQDVLEIIQGIYLSQLEGRRIHLPLTQRKHPLEAGN